jgi:Asp-tRNA(Asn)/Glu-tRNA(Gln) amidotransferase B subunit
VFRLREFLVGRVVRVLKGRVRPERVYEVFDKLLEK